MPTKYDPRRKRVSPPSLAPAVEQMPVPENQDFSPTAAAKRELAKQLDYSDTMRELNKKYTRVTEAAQEQPVAASRGGVSSANLQSAYYTSLISEVRTQEAQRRSKTDLSKFPVMKDIVAQAAMQGADITPDDVQKLVDFAVLNDAADTIIAGLNPEVGDPYVVDNVTKTLSQTNPVMASFLLPIVEEKLAAAITEPTVLETFAQRAGEIINTALTPFMAAYEWTAQGVAAGNYAAANSGRDEFTWPNQIAGFFNPSDRAAVEPGKLNEAYIQQLRDATNEDGTPVYTPLQIEIAVELVQRQARGDATPIADLWNEKYLGNLQAAEIFGDIAYNRAGGNTQELIRQVESASLSDLGQSMLGSALNWDYSQLRGSETFANAADVTGFVTGLAIDPTNLAFGAGRAFQAARWSLTRLAPGIGEADKVLRSMRLGAGPVGFQANPAYRYFDNLTKDLNKYDDLRKKARDAAEAGNSKAATKYRANAADLRNRMARQYDEMPEKLIDDFYTSMPRNADGKFDVKSAAAWIDETNNAYLTTLDEVAPKMAQIAEEDAVKRASLLQILAVEGDPVKLRKAQTALSSLDEETAAALKPLQDQVRDAQNSTFYSQVGRTTQRFTPLVPRMSALGRLRKDAVNSIRVSQMSSRAVDKMISKYLPSIDDAGQFADDLSRNAEALGFDVRAYRAGASSSAPLAGTADSVARMFSSLPDVRLLNLTDASSTKQFYRLARAFFPKRMSRMMADQWRNGTAGSRRKMVNGLVRSAAAVRGITMTDDELAAFIRGVPTVQDLATGTRLGERYAVTVNDGILPSERSAGVATPPTEPISLSADANGIEHALHLDDTADYVRIPSMRDFEELRKEMGLATQGYYWAGRGAEHTTNLMSFLTLYGLRFSLRNAIEEDGLYLFMGGGLGNLAKGRAMDQAIRRATPRAVVKIEENQPKIVWKSSLGMFANKLEWASLKMRKGGMPEWLNEFVYSSVDRKAAEAALAAKKAGDPEAYAKLVVESVYSRKIGRTGFSLLSDDDRKMLQYFAESSHGQALYDEVAGGAQYLQNAAMPNFANDVDMLDGAIPGVTMAKMPNPNRLTIEGYGNVRPIQVDPISGDKIMGVSAWWSQIEKTLVGDGPIGEAAVRLLNKPAKAKEEIARIIREDTEFGYRERFSRITDDMAVDEFANAYFENVYQHFTKADGTLNVNLRSQFMEFNPETGMDEATFWRLTDDGEGLTARVRMSDLEDYSTADRPEFVFGPRYTQQTYVPVAESEAALLTPTRGFAWMGRQNARISRGPIFNANMMTAWRQTKPARDALAESLARGAGRAEASADDIALAERLYAKDAMDQAYTMTLSYLDNPANRSNLAWKARNISRYYRATEDFWRRMKRVAANKPETFWRVALTYHLLTDTGFVYQDDEGTAYFGYPGNEQLNQAVSAAGMLFGLEQLKYVDTNPFFTAGKLSGMTPSTDPMQQLPSAFGVGAVALTGIYSAFPALYKLKGLQKLTLGQYASVTGNPVSDVIGALTPPLVERVQNMTDPEQFDASVGQAAMDTLAIMSAEGLLDTVTIDGQKIPAEALQSSAQFKQSEEYAASQKIALANFVTRLFFQTAGPAAPQQYSNTVSKVARDMGVMGMKPLFRTLIDQNSEAPDPFAAAYSQFLGMQTKRVKDGEELGIADFLPFTMSTYKSPTDTPDSAQAALARVRAGTDKWLKWYESDQIQDLKRKGYYVPSLFLAPRDGEFDWASWSVAKNDLGLKVKKSDNEMIMDLLALNGEHTDSLIRASYDELIAAQDPNTPAGKEAISALTEQRDMDRQSNKVLNPAWDVVDGQRFSAYTDANYRALFGGMRNMLTYMQERDGKLSGSAEMINNAIGIYLYYQQQIVGLTGPGAQREAAKKAKKAEMDAELAQIKQIDENAAVFIESVIDNLSYKPQFPAFGEG